MAKQTPLSPAGTPKAHGKTLSLAWDKGAGASHPHKQGGQLKETQEVTPSTQGHLCL